MYLCLCNEFQNKIHFAGADRIFSPLAELSHGHYREFGSSNKNLEEQEESWTHSVTNKMQDKQLKLSENVKPFSAAIRNTQTEAAVRILSIGKNNSIGFSDF